MICLPSKSIIAATVIRSLGIDALSSAVSSQSALVDVCLGYFI